MDWTIILCLMAAFIFAGLFLLIFREIFRDISRVGDSQVQDCSTAPDDDDRTATLMLRHSFVVTMMDQYRDTGSQCDIMDFINGELRARNASWRVRTRSDGSGEFFDLKPPNKINGAIFSSSRWKRKRG
jgi:hypothetical protein